MEPNETAVVYRYTRKLRTAPSGDIKWLSMSFTEAGLRTVRAYRQKIATETGQHLALGQALDALLATHPEAAK